MLLRVFATGLVLCAYFGAVADHALAQGYPNRPIWIVVPFAAGGAVDTFARISTAVGQPVLIENRPGAAGNIGADAVARSSPDGYRILQTTNGHALNPAVRLKLSYDPVKDFVPVTQLTSSPVVLVASSKHGISSVRGLVARAKERPGSISYGSAGVGSLLHLAMEMLKVASGIDIVHVPYGGDAPLNTALLAGEVQVAIVPLATALPHFRSGALRALAVTTRQRSSVLQDVPTVAESGFPGFEVASWQAWFMPAGTPPEIVARMQTEARKAMAAPEVAERFGTFGAEVVGSSPIEFSERFKRDVESFKKVVWEAKILAQD